MATEVVEETRGGVEHVNGADAPRSGGSGSALLARRAEEYLRTHVPRNVTIRELCTVLQVPERTLHLAFRRHVGTSPKAYLKVLRLNAVHRDLVHSKPGLTVTSAGMRWGFYHPGWFAHSYAQLFGLPPSETLRRVRAQSARTG